MSDRAIVGAIERVSQLPLLGDNEINLNCSGWNSNWADWDNSGGHNDWDNWAPTPPGGK